jgi:hypothetical protein
MQSQTLNATGVPFNAEFYFQAGWFTQGAFGVSRFTTLPVF